jgi:protein phosphatase inhibitor 2
MDGEYEEDDGKPAAVDRSAPSAPIDAATSDYFSATTATAHPTMRVKPALKKGNRSRRSATSTAQSTNASGSGAAMNADSTTSATINKHLKWDEQVIEEHDLLRGTRMKIDEPNTPYTHYDSGSESDHSRPKSPAHQKPTLSWDNLQSRLDSVVAVQEQFAAAAASAASAASSAVEDQTNAAMDASSSDVEEEIRNEMRILEFREHRKRHYNEMELVRQFRQQQPDLDEDDLDDDDDGRPLYGSVAHANGGMD